MNLDQTNTIELSFEDKKSIEGGIIPVALGIIGIFGAIFQTGVYTGKIIKHYQDTH